MQGIFYLLAIIAVSVVFYWFVRNDRIGEGEHTRGWLAYKDSDPDQPTGKRKKKRAKEKWGHKAEAAKKPRFPAP